MTANAEPENVLRATSADPAQMAGAWSVARVATNHEGKVARFLEDLGIDCYLPSYERIDYYAKWTHRRQAPLFTGYVFVCIGFCVDGFAVRRHKSVYEVISVSDQKRLARELSQIHTAAQAGDLRPHGTLVRGQRVRVKAGPLKGIEGLLEFAGSSRFILRVELLGASTSLEIDPALIEPIVD